MFFVHPKTCPVVELPPLNVALNAIELETTILHHYLEGVPTEGKSVHVLRTVL